MPAAPRPFCFALMPFGTKPDGTGRQVDFDSVYRDIIAPAIEAAGMEPIRADQETAGGIIHKPMFERLMLCDYAVADLTGANANVFYELGVRHAVKPHTTVSIFAKDARLPFDVSFLRALPYALDEAARIARPAEVRDEIAARLTRAREEVAVVDSPVYQLIDGWAVPPPAREKTDTFREQVVYARDKKAELARVRDGAAKKVADPHEKKRLSEASLAAIDRIRDAAGKLSDLESGLVIDLLLSYRALGTKDGCTRMIELVAAMPVVLAETAMVQEQLGFALNRVGRRDEAERVLRAVIAKHGPSSETYGLLGRVMKDRWQAASDVNEKEGLLELAIEAYLLGFEADWRDAYPGVNAVTLMEIAGDARRGALVPVVRYALERKMARGSADYWDHATQLELAVLADERASVRQALKRALPLRDELWKGETTANNLRMIREARASRGDDAGWIADLERSLGA